VTSEGHGGPIEPAAPARRRVAGSTKLYYGFGSVAEGTKSTAFNVFLLFYYNQVLGVPGVLTGAAIFIALCMDAVTDPLVGSLSDNLHSRWGRRHPFMYSAAVPMAVCFLLLFNPPAALGEAGLFSWLTVFAVGVRVSMTLYQIPSNSMVPELTDHYDERTSLVSYRFLFGWLGGLAVSLMGYLYFFAPSASFTDGRLDPDAYGAFALVGAVIIGIAILTCALGTHRLIPTLRSPAERIPFSLGRFSGEVRAVLANPSYRMLLGVGIFSAVAGGFSDVVGLYMNTYFWEFSTAQIAILVYGLVVSVFLAFTLTPPLAVRFDKKHSALGLATFAIFFGPLPIFLRLAGVMPENGEPLLLYLIFGHSLVLVAIVVAIGIVVSSMIADVVDESELATGRRQEGMFASAIAFFTKATSGLGGLFAGIALDVIAFPKGAQPGAVDPSKVFNLGLAVGPGLMILYLVTLVFMSRYRITRARHGEILAELEIRRRGR
jgi:Na+/melibiose symporter-like transporter